MDGRLADGTLVVPFARWAAVASAYADRSFAGLREFARDEAYETMVLGLLEELNSTEAVDALLELFTHVFSDPAAKPALLRPVVRTINLLFSIKTSPANTREQREAVAAFLNKALGMAVSNTDRGVIMYAMRGAGNSDSLAALSNSETPDYPYTAARAAAIRAIRKRQRDDA